MATPATVQNLIEQMTQNNSVVNNWDVVFNMLEDSVNKIFQMSYRKSGKSICSRFDVCYCECSPDPGSSGQIASYTDINYIIDNPILSIAQNNSSYMHIVFKAYGQIRTASMQVSETFDPVKNANPGEFSLIWKIVQSGNTDFTADVPLSVVQGSTVQTPYVFASVLDFPEGSFDSPFFKQINNNDKLQKELRNYFLNNNVRFIINQINSRVLNQLPDLTPHSFKIGTVVTDYGKKILSMFICTTGTMQSNLTINVNEPIPDGSDFSIMINQRMTEELCAVSAQQISLFALENFIFPADGLISLSQQYTPCDILVLGNFKLLSKIKKISGDNQSLSRSGYNIPGGIANFAPLTIQVVDAMGTPLIGKEVTFTPGNHPCMMAVQISPAGCDTIKTTTDANGNAVLNGMGMGSYREFIASGIAVFKSKGGGLVSVTDQNAVLNSMEDFREFVASGNAVLKSKWDYSASVYYADGVFSINASVEDGETVSFNLTVVPATSPPILPGTKFNIISGNNQSVARIGYDIPGSIAVFTAMVVQLVDIHNNPIPNALVNFKVGNHPDAMVVQIHPSGAEPVTVITDENGYAVLNQMLYSGAHAYYADGAFSINASVEGGGSVSLNHTVLPPALKPVIRSFTVDVSPVKNAYI